MKENIAKLKDCYGCGVCVKICPVNIISLVENKKEGFYFPEISDKNKCIECGLCLKVCAFNHNDVAKQTQSPRGYAVWSKDETIRLTCSSGGVGFEIGKWLIESGYNGIGVKYNTSKNRAEHFVACNISEYKKSIGSKYIQSFTELAFDKIEKDKKYLITGTPCQIDSLRRYINYLKIDKNIILLDFFCHGVPSLLLWDKYIKEVSDIVGSIKQVSWRNKFNGWHDSWSMTINPENITNYLKTDKRAQLIEWQDSYNLNIWGKKNFYSSRMSQGDLFYKFFLGNLCLNKCCYKKCKYKICSSAADIRIGDLWGPKYKKNKEGVSAVLVFTDKGEEILRNLSNSRCTVIEERVDTVTEGQMRKSPPYPFVRNRIIKALNSPLSLEKIDKLWGRFYRIFLLPKKITYKIRRRLMF